MSIPREERLLRFAVGDLPSGGLRTGRYVYMPDGVYRLDYSQHAVYSRKELRSEWFKVYTPTMAPDLVASRYNNNLLIGKDGQVIEDALRVFQLYYPEPRPTERSAGAHYKWAVDHWIKEENARKQLSLKLKRKGEESGDGFSERVRKIKIFTGVPYPALTLARGLEQKTINLSRQGIKDYLKEHVFGNFPMLISEVVRRTKSKTVTSTRKRTDLEEVHRIVLGIHRMAGAFGLTEEDVRDIVPDDVTLPNAIYKLQR